MNGKVNGRRVGALYRKLTALFICASAFILFIAVSGGCAPGGGASGAADRAAGSGAREAAAAPLVNSAIYSNDYIVDKGPVKGGSLRIYATKPDTYNPLLTRNYFINAAFSLVYEGLAKPGPNATVYRWLAQSWEPSEDGLSWTVVLRSEARWQDGRQLNAYDVVNTIERIKSYGNESPYAELVSNIDTAVVTSVRELRLDLIQENSFTPYTLIFPIVPSHIAIDALDGESGGANLRVALLGTGPYKYRGYESGKSIMLTIADDWWRKDDVIAGDYYEAADAGHADGFGDANGIGDVDGNGDLYGIGDVDRIGGANGLGNADGISGVNGIDGDSERLYGIGAAAETDASRVTPPYIRDVNFILYDASTPPLPQLRENNVDMFFSRVFNYAQYRYTSEMSIKNFCDREFLFIAMNCNKGMTGVKNVRRALLRMTDRDRFIEDAFGGKGAAAEFPVQPGSPLYGETAACTPYDPQAARSILEGEGFRLDEGMYYGDIGHGWQKLEFTLLVNAADETRIEIAKRLSAIMEENGVALNVTAVPADEIISKVNAGDYEMALLGYRTPSYPDMTELYSTPRTPGKGTTNPAHYQNDEADALALELFSLYDETDRRTAFSELVAILRDDAPYLGLCFMESSLVYDAYLLGDVLPGPWAPLGFFEYWYLADYQ